MDWLQFWSSIVSSLAWPLAAVIVALAFRKQFVGLLEKLHSFEGPGIKANFNAQVVAVAQEVDAQLVEVQQEEPLLKAQPAKDIADMIAGEALRQRMSKQMERYRPAAIVIEAWDELEGELLKLFAPRLEEGAATFSLAMLEEAKLPSNLLKSISEMRDLRNDVVHKSGFEPSVLAAERYRRNVERIVTVARAHKALLPIGAQISMGRE